MGTRSPATTSWRCRCPLPPAARRICREEDDFSFVRNHLDQELADQLKLFVYETRSDGETRVASRDLRAIREAIIGPKYNYGAPCIAVKLMHDDDCLLLERRPVTLHATDFRGASRIVQANAPSRS